MKGGLEGEVRAVQLQVVDDVEEDELQLGRVGPRNGPSLGGHRGGSGRKVITFVRGAIKFGG